ncbi:uncharacterized protein LOC113505137 [Trichoplusia ni]|uniref:Uncharacterized protein LOC113505137 n=1 Tax=Trichoplusia ni TaxID=7111 RepID=A0A7E5WTJ8_TRINI|nr:uncharacterized protein LOC113505137 [Trichoplusia ni]
MFALVFHILFVLPIMARSILDSINFKQSDLLRNMKKLNLNESYFGNLENYQVNAETVSEKQYPWIARVVHSKKALIPHVCTAVCVDEAIFITAARCIYTLKVNYTRVIYMSKKLNVVAFVLPSEPTKQLFDDIGFLVTDTRSFKGMWAIIELFDTVNRTDDAFRWFSDLDFSYGSMNFKVVGYAMKKGIHKIKAPEIQYNLTELSVVVGIDLCPSILTYYGKIKGFNVPCYHSCTVQQFQKSVDKCFNYHGVEGGALYDTLNKKLMGVATWGAYFQKWELPVGFAVANSINFFKDLKCARRIRDDNGIRVTKGYYQNLCDDNA